MPRRTRAELEVENAELRDRLASVYDNVVDYFDDDEDVEEVEDEDIVDEEGE